MQIKDAMVHDTLRIASPPAIDRELLTEYAPLSSVCAFDAFHHPGCRHDARASASSSAIIMEALVAYLNTSYLTTLILDHHKQPLVAYLTSNVLVAGCCTNEWVSEARVGGMSTKIFPPSSVR
jgi:hypothetical protein